MSVTHESGNKIIKLNDKYSLNIVKQWEEQDEWANVYLISETMNKLVGSYNTNGFPYEREWIEYDEQYIAFLHQDLISQETTINRVIDLTNLIIVEGGSDAIKYYAAKILGKKLLAESENNHYMIRGERLNDCTSILIENKYENNIGREEVSIQKQFIEVEPKFLMLNGKQYMSALKPQEKNIEIKLGSHVTFAGNELKGWIEYNEQYVAFMEYSSTTGKRKVVKLYDVIAQEYIEGLNSELEQLYKQSFAADIIARQETKLPIKKLELKK